MSSTCHYRGNHVDDLIAQAETGHLFGPDTCGHRPVSFHDLRSAFQTGAQDLIRMFIAAGALPRGVYYDLESAEYDPETDLTTATFAPHIDPMQRIRYVGGNEDDETLGRRGLADVDDIRRR